MWENRNPQLKILCPKTEKTLKTGVYIPVNFFKQHTQYLENETSCGICNQIHIWKNIEIKSRHKKPINNYIKEK